MHQSTAFISDIAVKMMKKRVLFKKENGEQESPLDAYKRVADFVASGHAIFNPNDKIKFRDKVVEMMAESKFMPNTPTIVNAGFPNAQCSACFVLPIEDNLKSIYKAHHDQGLIQSSGGGTGMYMGNIRSKGTKASGRFITKGPVEWIRMLNENATHVLQGMREGANIAVLDVGHPGIIEFIKCKQTGYNISQEMIEEQFNISPREAKKLKAIIGIERFNLSVSINNKFMQALDNGEEWYFIDPHTKQKHGSMPTQEIWDLLIESAWKSGEPGIIFEDTVNLYNPLSHIGRIQACNPCSEKYMLPYGSCVLGHINLSKYVVGSNGSSNINYDGLEDAIRFGIQFLDDIVEINSFPIPELKEMNNNSRQVGLGVMGWADILAMLNIAYDSNEAIDKINEIGGFFQKIAEDETTKLGKDRGNFPYFEGSAFQKSGIKYRRNAEITTIAPTGQTSMYAGCSSSIEPIIFPVIKRKQADMEQIDYHPALFKILEQRGLDTAEIRDKLGNLGSVREATFLPDDIRRIFPSSHDVSYEWHVKHQMTWQKYISSGISKTINMHKDATKEDVDNAFRMAFKGGCKGITVYRDGSRSGQPLSSLKKHQGLVKSFNKRDEVTHGTNRKVPTGCGHLMIFVGEGSDGRIQEFTSRLGKSGGCSSSQIEAISRLGSIALQHGAEPAYIAEQLSGIRCHLSASHKSKYTGDRPRIITSCADAISVAIQEHLANGSKDVNLKHPNNHSGACPECGGQLSYEEGCAKCYNCFFARC